MPKGFTPRTKKHLSAGTTGGAGGPGAVKDVGGDRLRLGIVNVSHLSPPRRPGSGPPPSGTPASPFDTFSPMAHPHEELNRMMSSGSDGEDGSMGPPGRDGIIGVDGAPGQSGPPGMDGTPGEDGADGAPGNQGAPGADGAPGVSDVPGPMGPPGTDGQDGEPGPMGPTGATGADGASSGGPAAFLSSEVDTAPGTPPLTINVPAGVLDGDLLIAFVAMNFAGADGNISDAPAGWTALDVQRRETDTAYPYYLGLRVWYRFASSEPASYNFTSIAGSYRGGSGAILAFSDADGMVPTVSFVEAGDVLGTAQTYLGVATSSTYHVVVAAATSMRNTASAGWAAGPAGLTDRTGDISSGQNFWPDLQVWSEADGPLSGSLTHTESDVWITATVTIETAGAADGADGADGQMGPPGADGEDGPSGPPGVAGSAGAAGADGADGQMGPPGADGANGAPGADGDEPTAWPVPFVHVHPAEAALGGGATKISGNTGAFVADTTWETLTADSAGVTVTTQTTVMTITGVGAGTYRIKGVLIWKTALTTTGIGITLNHTGTLTQFVSTWWTTTTGGAAATGIADQVTATAAGQLVEGKSERVKDTRSSFTVGTDTNLGTQLSVIEALMIVTVSGDLQLKIATEIAGSAATLLAGSTLEVNKVV